MLAHGAALDAADNRGRTALMIAAALGDAATVDVLLKRGADRALKDKDGKTARDLAANAEVRAEAGGEVTVHLPRAGEVAREATAGGASGGVRSKPTPTTAIARSGSPLCGGPE